MHIEPQFVAFIKISITDCLLFVHVHVGNNYIPCVQSPVY